MDDRQESAGFVEDTLCSTSPYQDQPRIRDRGFESRVESSSEDEREAVGAGQAGEEARFSATPLSLIAGSDRNFSLRNMLNPVVSHRHSREKAQGTGQIGEGDLIARGILSMDMAFQLFAL